MVAHRTPEEIELRVRAEWQRKLQQCVLRGAVPIPRVVDADTHYELHLDGWDVHELYTVLVEPIGPEGCCAGCTRLPPGWCAACDRNRETETPSPEVKPHAH